MMTVPNFYRIETSGYDLSRYNRLIEGAARQLGRLHAARTASRGWASSLEPLYLPQAQKRDRRL